MTLFDPSDPARRPQQNGPSSPPEPGSPAPRPTGRGLRGGEIALLVSGIVVGLVVMIVLAVLSVAVVARSAVILRELGVDTGSSGGWSEWTDEVDPSDPLSGYPGYEEGDAEWILGAPSAEETVATAEEATGVLEAELAPAPAASWTTSGDDFYKRGFNAYGGAALIYDYVSSDRLLEAAVAGDLADKQALVDRFETALEPYGYDVVDVADDPEGWEYAGYDVDTSFDYGETPEDSEALWIVTATSASGELPTIEFSIFDLANDSTGAVQEMIDAAGEDVPAEGLRLRSFAWNLLEEGDRDAFIERMDEFGGVLDLDSTVVARAF